MVKSLQDDPDEEVWGPRKSAKVSFANDIVVEEILDLNGKAHNVHDVADLIKFISPRQRRCKR